MDYLHSIALPGLAALAFAIGWKRTPWPLRVPRVGDAEVPFLDMALRQFETEIARARRHERPLSILVLRVESDGGSKSPLATAPPAAFLGARVRRAVRETDLVAYDRAQDRLIVALPETDRKQAQITATRLAELAHWHSGHRARTGVAVFPDEVLVLGDLLEAAACDTMPHPHHAAHITPLPERTTPAATPSEENV